MTLWDEFLIAIAPESTGEAHVRENFYKESVGVGTNWQNFPDNATTPRLITDPVGPLDKFLIAITPQSHGEAIVESIYSPENMGYPPEDYYDSEMDWSAPEIVHIAGQKVASAIASVKTGLGLTVDYLKYALIGFLVIVIIYFGLMLFVNRR